MLLTLSTTHVPATDFGYLLHKNPARVHEADLSFGKAISFYSEADDALATYVLLLDIDPVSLVRGKSKSDSGLLDQYVNDRPYAASSFLSVAIAKTLRNALQGTSKERPDLAQTAIPLKARVLPLPVQGNVELVERLFTPLGYELKIESIPLDDALSHLGEGWLESRYISLELSAYCRLRDLLAHLYVLIPVLDRQKHYYVDRHELDKLLSKGEGWLKQHPEKELIARRYLPFKRSWAREALRRLSEDDAQHEFDFDARTADAKDEDGVRESQKDAAEVALEKPIRLHDQRLEVVTDTLIQSGARRVVDLGCGSGKLLKRLMAEKQFDEILGVDVSTAYLERAERRLRLERLPERQRQRIRLVQGALTYRDSRTHGFDAAVLVEVIEHLEPDRLPSLEQAVFGSAQPKTVIVTTPNREYNQKFEGMEPGQLRHKDHRFEWTREEFANWAKGVSERNHYRVSIMGIGEEDDVLGAPSQMAVFKR